MLKKPAPGFYVASSLMPSIEKSAARLESNTVQGWRQAIKNERTRARKQGPSEFFSAKCKSSSAQNIGSEYRKM